MDEQVTSSESDRNRAVSPIVYRVVSQRTSGNRCQCYMYRTPVADHIVLEVSAPRLGKQNISCHNISLLSTFTTIKSSRLAVFSRNQLFVPCFHLVAIIQTCTYLFSNNYLHMCDKRWICRQRWGNPLNVILRIANPKLLL